MNKKIIITGASRGIGRELVKCFLEQGHDVLAISRNEEKLKELEKFATKSTYRYLALDLADFEGLTKVNSAIADWVRVDVLYNNEGYLVNKTFDHINDKGIDQSIVLIYEATSSLIHLIFSISYIHYSHN